MIRKNSRDNLSGKKIGDNAKIMPFGADLKISYVASPNSVWFVRIEFSIKEILEIAGLRFDRFSRNFTGSKFGQIHRFE